MSGSLFPGYAEDMEIAELKAEVDRFTTLIDAALTLHFQYRASHRDDTDVCAECSRIQGMPGVPWPCATVAALIGSTP